MSDLEFSKLVGESKSYIEVVRHFNLKANSNIKTVKNRILRDKLDISHFYGRSLGFIALKDLNKTAKPLTEILILNSTYNSTRLCKRLINEGYLNEKCSCCGIGNIYNNKPITLQLDHINGNHYDNRIENLRIICPNCHSQTKTFGYQKQPRPVCSNCGRKITKRALTGMCPSCRSKSQIRVRKVEDRPNTDLILESVNKFGYRATGRIYGVSDNTIRKWLKV